MIWQPNNAASPEYRVLVLIGWRILWQAVGSFLLLLFLANLALLGLIPELTRTGPSFLALFVPLMAVTVIVALLVMPAVVRALLGTSFGGFRLQLISNDASASSHSTKPLTATRRSGHETDNGNPHPGADARPEPSGGRHPARPRQ